MKRNTRYLKSDPFLEEWLHNEEFLSNSNQINRLKQAYKAISMDEGDIVYVRGKKGSIDEGWLFEVSNTKIEYILKDSKQWPMLRLKTICKVSDEIYQKITFNPSFQKIKSLERIELLSSLV